MKKNDFFSDLSDICRFSWQELVKVVHQKNHPWRSPVIANLVNDQITLRTVILRQAVAEERRLRFYTDGRSAKMEAIKAGGSISWLFYDPSQQLQLRIQSSPVILLEAERKLIWQQLPVVARSSYASIAVPGSVNNSPTDGLPTDFYNRSLVETNYAEANFRVVDTIVYQMEVLKLERSGHRRTTFSWDTMREEWVGEWLVA